MARTIKSRMESPPQPRTDGAGVDHNIVVAFLDADDNDINIMRSVFPIPNDDFAGLLGSMSSTARANLYRSLIIEHYGGHAIPLEAPSMPVGLSDLSAIEDYLDAKDVYDTELAERNSDAATMATQATAWIESLSAFDGWPFDFILQQGD